MPTYPPRTTTTGGDDLADWTLLGNFPDLTLTGDSLTGAWTSLGNIGASVTLTS